MKEYSQVYLVTVISGPLLSNPFALHCGFGFLPNAISLCQRTVCIKELH